MAPGRVATEVVRVSTEVKAGPETLDTARVLTAPPVLEDAAGEFSGPVDVIGFASTSTSYAIGFDDETTMVARVSERTGVPVASTCASALAALRVLGIERIALVSPPWFDDEANRVGAAYFVDQCVHVVSTHLADVSRDPGSVQATEVIEWTARHIPDDAEAIWMSGNGFRVAGAVDALENKLGRPVLTANQVLLWSLLGLADADFEISGYGELFAHRPR